MQNSALACSVAVLSLATWVELRGVSASASSARASTSVCSVAAPLSEPSFSLQLLRALCQGYLELLLESVHGAITLLFSELYSPWPTQVANIILITF